MVQGSTFIGSWFMVHGSEFRVQSSGSRFEPWTLKPEPGTLLPMICNEVLDAIELSAAGQLAPDDRIAAHLSSCLHCAAAPEDARRLEQILQARPVPRALAQFSSRTMARVRRARWRTEQFLDLGFKITLTLVLLAILGSIRLLLHHSGLVAALGIWWWAERELT